MSDDNPGPQPPQVLISITGEFGNGNSAQATIPISCSSTEEAKAAYDAAVKNADEFAKQYEVPIAYKPGE